MHFFVGSDTAVLGPEYRGTTPPPPFLTWDIQHMASSSSASPKLQYDPAQLPNIEPDLGARPRAPPGKEMPFPRGKKMSSSQLHKASNKFNPVTNATFHKKLKDNAKNRRSSFQGASKARFT